MAIGDGDRRYSSARGRGGKGIDVVRLSILAIDDTFLPILELTTPNQGCEIHLGICFGTCWVYDLLLTCAA